MDNYIYINLDLFAKESSMFLADDTTSEPNFIGKYSLAELPKAIVEQAYINNVYKVKIVGSNKFSQLIEYEIASKEITKYNENKIEIEVI